MTHNGIENYNHPFHVKMLMRIEDKDTESEICVLHEAVPQA